MNNEPNVTEKLVSIQYALALLIGEHLELSKMLKAFIPTALKMLHCNAAFVWINKKSQSEPIYSYPRLRGSFDDLHRGLAVNLGFEKQLNNPHESYFADDKYYHCFSLQNIGMLVFVRQTELSEKHIQALFPIMKRLSTACNACLQHESIGAARLKAEEGSNAKSEFLAMISHEIRSPMNGVLGMANLIQFTELTKEQNEYIESIKTSGQTLLDIINEILDFSSIESGKADLVNEVFDLKKLIKDTVVPLKIAALEKNLKFETSISDDIPKWIHGDSGRLKQVWINLLSNAIKFTEKGKISFNVAMQSDSTENLANLQFAVKDTGIGIRSDKKSKIFEPFQQANGAINRQYGGTGLGLAITSRIVNMMEGKIFVESDEENGSLFYFSVPFRIEKDPIEDKTDLVEEIYQNARTYNILLAEDNKINQMVAQRLLEKVGHKVSIAEDGLEAIALWKANDFDLILMDMQMPRMDGLEACQTIRSLETGVGIPIIALTANAMERDKERCLDMGMNGFLSKPFHPNDLYLILDEMSR